MPPPKVSWYIACLIPRCGEYDCQHGHLAGSSIAGLFDSIDCLFLVCEEFGA